VDFTDWSEMNVNPKQPAGEAADEWPLHYDNPARQALREMGITQLTQLTRFKEAELLRLHGVGPKAIRLLRESLAQRGLAFAPPEPAPAAKRGSVGGYRE
jgi:hypothetical protein